MQFAIHIYVVEKLSSDKSDALNIHENTEIEQHTIASILENTKYNKCTQWRI